MHDRTHVSFKDIISMPEAFSTPFVIHYAALDQFRVTRNQFTNLQGCKKVPCMKL
jgi:hypothetical protein